MMHSVSSVELGQGEPHPKDVLYDQVYDLITPAWFSELMGSPQRKHLLDTAGDRDTAATLVALNEVFHDAVDASMASLGEKKTADIIAVIGRYREYVGWDDQLIPGPGAGQDELRESFIYKIKRNISLGAVVALICLESATRYARTVLGLAGEPLADLLRRSRQLYSSLALLHDDHEHHRMAVLTGITDYPAYPSTDYADVLDGRYHIAADKFVVVGSGEDARLRFVSTPAYRLPLNGPIKRCPAHRATGDHDDGTVPNDALWDLLIDVYAQSGRFA